MAIPIAATASAGSRLASTSGVEHDLRRAVEAPIQGDNRTATNISVGIGNGLRLSARGARALSCVA
jgi:hypothetical protein